MASSALTASQNADLDATTRAMWQKTRVPQVLLRMPLYAKLLDRNRRSWSRGDKYVFTADYQETDSVGQWYGKGTGLTAGRAVSLTKPWFLPKFGNIPVRADMEEMLLNGSGEETVINLSEYLVKKAQRAARILLYKAAYAAASTDTSTGFQSIVQALNHDATYAHTTRATTVTNKWFQGASLDDTFADQDTARTCDVSLVRAMYSKIMKYVEDPADVILICGDTNYLTLKAEVSASTKTTKQGTMAKYGFASFMIDDQIEVVQDYFLSAAELPAETTPQKWMFMLNVDHWHLMLHPERSFALKPFRWQGEMTNGADEWLGRVLIAGNLACDHPASSMWLSNVT